MNTSRNLLAGALLAAILGLWNTAPHAQGEPIAVIVHPSNPVSSLSVSELKSIFLTTGPGWGSAAGDAYPINFRPDDPLRQEFDKAVLGLNPDQVVLYWQDRRRRGGAFPPVQVSSRAAVLRAVAGMPGAVGYVRASEVNATVKVVATITGK